MMYNTKQALKTSAKMQSSQLRSTKSPKRVTKNTQLARGQGLPKMHELLVVP